MKKVNAANTVLSDPQEKIKYDRYGHDAYTQFGYRGGESPSEAQSKRARQSRTHRFWSRQFWSGQSHSGASGAGGSSGTGWFSNTFKDIFTKDKSSKSQRKLKDFPRASFLLYTILNNISSFQQTNTRPPYNIRQEQRTALAALKELLINADISQLNKDTLRRILKDFYIDFPESRRRYLFNILNSWAEIFNRYNTRREKGAIDTYKGNCRFFSFSRSDDYTNSPS